MLVAIVPAAWVNVSSTNLAVRAFESHGHPLLGCRSRLVVPHVCRKTAAVFRVQVFQVLAHTSKLLRLAGPPNHPGWA